MLASAALFKSLEPVFNDLDLTYQEYKEGVVDYNKLDHVICEIMGRLNQEKSWIRDIILFEKINEPDCYEVRLQYRGYSKTLHCPRSLLKSILTGFYRDSIQGIDCPYCNHSEDGNVDPITHKVMCPDCQDTLANFEAWERD